MGACFLNFSSTNARKWAPQNGLKPFISNGFSHDIDRAADGTSNRYNLRPGPPARGQTGSRQTRSRQTVPDRPVQTDQFRPTGWGPIGCKSSATCMGTQFRQRKRAPRCMGTLRKHEKRVSHCMGTRLLSIWSRLVSPKGSPKTVPNYLF